MTPKNKPTLRKNTTAKTIDNSNHQLELSNSSKYSVTKKYSDSEISKVMSEILNVSTEQIIMNIALFQNINNYVFNALFYLSKISCFFSYLCRNKRVNGHFYTTCYFDNS